MASTDKKLEKCMDKNLLKPWLKDKLTKSIECCHQMLRSKQLVDLYKCMGNSCSFTTNESAVMENHLYTHGNTRDALVCAYCRFSAVSQPRLLLAHIENRHGQCKYQCRFCFYRAFDAGIVVFHQRFHHNDIENTKHSIIVLSSVEDQPYIDMTNEVYTSFLRSRKTLRCQACDSAIVSISLFAAHVKTHGKKEIECPLCSALVDTRMVQVHLINHRMDYFECVYCNIVFSSKLKMQHHLYHKHHRKADFCGMKMKRCKQLCDVYVIEKLTNGVRDDRLVADTFVIDSLKFEAEQPLQSANILPVANQTEKIDLPKIVKVEGGIRMTDNGEILKATVAESAVSKDDENNEVAENRNGTSGRNTTASPFHAQSSPSAPKAISNSIKVKDFRFIRALIRNSESNESAPRKRVKLTKLADGSMVLNLPTSKSAPEMTSATCESKLGAVVPAVFGLNGTEASIRGAQLIHDEQLSSKMFSIAQSMVREPPHELLPVVGNTGCTDITNFTTDDQSAAASATTNVRENQKDDCSSMDGGEDDDDDDDDEEDFPGYNEDALSSNESPKEARNIRFHLSGYEEKIDQYAFSLKTLVALRPFTGEDFFLCGTVGCLARFSLPNDLLVHARSCFKSPELGTIMCKHCKLVVRGVDSYVVHLKIHRLESFVCFLCSHNHFLLSNVVEHMKIAHKCNALRISFAHPQKLNLLKDVIVVIPLGLCQADMKSNIDRTINEVTNALIRPPVPRQVIFSILYKCGFCAVEVLTNKLCFKKHILLCAQKIDRYYPCAHCCVRFANWRHRMDLIVHHLYFHGENLYQCSSCAYNHFQRSSVLDHIAQRCGNEGSTVNTVRQSQTAWKCHICFYRSFFKQGVMEHVQNSHNLPGERYLCSICDSRMFTVDQMETHCQERHRGKQVTMIEMYHPTSRTNDGKRYSRIDEEKLVIVPANHIHILNVTQINAKQKESQMVQDSRNESSRRNDASDVFASTSRAKITECHVQYLLNEDKSKHKVNELTEATLDPQADKKQHSSITEDIYLDSASDEDMDITQNRRKYMPLQIASVESRSFDTSLADEDECRVSGNEISIVAPNRNKDSSTTVNQSHNVTLINSNQEKLSLASTKKRSTDSSESNRILSPLSYVSALPLTNRRASKRVAAKSDACYQFQENFKYCCQSCKVCFETFADLEIHGSDRNNNDHHGTCLWTGNQINFRLLPLVRCFYCNEQDTCATLRRHCREEHSSKQFVCVDRLDMFKCGLCSYRNGSGNEKEFCYHFKCFHATSCSKFTPYEHFNDTLLDWALTLGRNTLLNVNHPEIKPIQYLCAHCKEVDACEASMGLHVAKHWLTFSCPQCQKKFKYLKGLYYHALAIHRIEDLAVPPTYASEYDEHLLDVLMVFENGLILSKREAQHTIVAFLAPLKAGFQTYYNEQRKSADSYKEDLLMPLFTDLDIHKGTCDRFIREQSAHLVLALEFLKDDYRDELDVP